MPHADRIEGSSVLRREWRQLGRLALESLGTGLFHLVKDEGQSKRMVNALTLRIALSVALFILLFIAWKGGMIQPHGVGR